MCTFLLTCRQIGEFEWFREFGVKGRLELGSPGVLEYTIDSSGERHQTFFNYSARTTLEPGEYAFVAIDEDTPLKRIVLFSNWIDGGGAN